MFELIAATKEDLATVAAAGDVYRRHWESFTSMPELGATFTGSPGDIGALDYLEYEQLGHPISGLKDTALVWGNVLVVQCGLQWLRSSTGDFWIGVYNKQGVLWPYSRLAEFIARDIPQFGKCVLLMTRVIEELLGLCIMPKPVHARLRRLQSVLEVGESFVEDIEKGSIDV